MQKQNKRSKIDINLKDVTLPHSIESEQALLGCLMLEPDIQLEIISKLTEGDFYSSAHKTIFETMRDINASSTPIDFVTLTDRLESEGTLESVGGIEYIANLTQIVPSSANYKHYLDIVTRDGALRRLIKSSSEIIVNAQHSKDKQEAIGFAEKEIFDISNALDNSEMVKINKVIPEVINKFDAIHKDKNAFRGINSGFKRLDYMTNGLHKTDFILIAARPAMGKTSFAMNIIENVAILEKKVCAVFSLEMGKEQLTQRMICSLAEVSMENALKGNLSKDEWGKITLAREKLANSKIFIDDSTLITPTEILSKCRRLKKQHGLDLVMIDYIQLMSGGGSKTADNRQQEVSEISRSLKVLAKEMQVPVIALSQLSRSVESRTDHRPQLSDIRESGAIEQDADIVMFIHRPGYYQTQEASKDEDANENQQNADDKNKSKVQAHPNISEIIVAKHRNGPTGTIELFFKNECTKFMNLEKKDGKYVVISDTPKKLGLGEYAKKDDETQLNADGKPMMEKIEDDENAYDKAYENGESASNSYPSSEETPSTEYVESEYADDENSYKEPTKDEYADDEDDGDAYEYEEDNPDSELF